MTAGPTAPPIDPMFETADLSAARPGYWDRADFPSRRLPRWPGVIRSVAYIAVFTALLPVQCFGLLASPRIASALPRLHHRILARILGLNIVCGGQPSSRPGTLYVCNHVSYLDIVVLGALLKARFISKADVSGWPGIGLLANLSRTLFIERRAGEARGQIDRIRHCLEAGDSLIMFPEGTSSDGLRVLPFKSTLFAAVQDTDLIVQPVSIRYLRLDGLPMGRALQPFCAWYGKMELLPHLWACLCRGSLEVRVVIDQPVPASRFCNRKALSTYCQRRVCEGADPGSASRLPRLTDA